MRLALLVPLAMLAAVPAVAQDAPPPAPRPMMHRPDMQAMRQRWQAMQQRREDDIALLIGLRPDQRAGLDALLGAMHPDRGDHPHRGTGRPGTDDAAPPGFEQRLDRMASRVDAKDGEAKRRIAAARAFYASLDAGQRARFDALERLHRGAIMMHGGRGMHGGMGHAGGWKHGAAMPHPGAPDAPQG